MPIWNTWEMRTNKIGNMSHSEHLLKSHANARRLLRSIAEADAAQLVEHELIRDETNPAKPTGNNG
jgi:hypothetical protein